MVAAMLAMTLMDATAKALQQSGLHPLQVVWARFTSQTVIVFLVLAPNLRSLLRTRYPAMQFIRSVFLFGATMCFFFSLGLMEIASATAVFEIAPLLITILAFLVLKEKVGVRRWVGVGIGLCGSLLIIRPGSDVFSFATLLPDRVKATKAAPCLMTMTISIRCLPGRPQAPSSKSCANALSARPARRSSNMA